MQLGLDTLFTPHVEPNTDIVPRWLYWAGRTVGVRSLLRSRLEAARNIAEVIVAKQRHGPIGTVKLQFTGEFTQFNDLASNERLPDEAW